jgi:hypothetical protein
MHNKLLLLALAASTMRLGAQAPTPEPHLSTESLRIQYTGRLFGYYRIEPGDTEARRLAPVKAFLAMREANGEEQTRPLLLGMGDNFAPEMGAALQLQHLDDKDCALPARGQFPETLYKTSRRYVRRAECDNVVKFLLEAGYRAIVPGREDFAYSATWLHKIGVAIRQTDSSHNSDKKLTMLAANIRVGISEKCPLLFSDDLYSKDNETCTRDDVPTKLDWLERIDRVRSPSSIRLRVQETASSNYGSYTLLGNEARAMESMLPKSPGWLPFRDTLSALTKSDSKLLTLTSSPRETSDEYKTQLQIVTDALQVLLCTLKNQPSSTGCKPQPAKSPMDFAASASELSAKCIEIENSMPTQNASAAKSHWEHDLCIYGQAMLREHEVVLVTKAYATSLSFEALDAARDALLRGIAAEQEDIGYTRAKIIENGQEKSLLIIGVAGQETMKAISLTDNTICFVKSDEHAGSPPERIVPCDTSGSIEGKVKVLNPIRTIRAILRAAELDGHQYDYRILMAQMPQTQAIELASRLNSCFGEVVPGVEPICVPDTDPHTVVPQVDLVLSEAQSGHDSTNLKMEYSRYVACRLPTCKEEIYRWSATPVLTPIPTYDINLQGVVRPDMTGVLETRPTEPITRSVCNTASDRSAWSCNPAVKASAWPLFESKHSALDLLMAAVEHASPSSHFVAPLVPHIANGATILTSADCMPGSTLLDGCEISVIQFLLKRMQERGQSDIAILQRRDIFLGNLPSGYDDYSACEPLMGNNRIHCELRMALDRVLWKGDYSELVMLSGKDIANLMAAASVQNNQEQSLQQADISGQWLVTFGIVTSPALNLTRSQPSGKEFSVIHDDSCNDAQELVHPSADGNDLYCVNGLPLIADHAYSVATTDYLDQNLVPKQPDNYYSHSLDYLTKTIEDGVFHPKPIAQQVNTAQVETDHQRRGLFQLDIAKVVAGYSFRAAPKGDNFIASAFQGVSDSRATSPSQSEVDIEAKERGIWRAKLFNFGVQTDMAYDRSAQGNLTGSPVNAIYPLNNLAVGGFLELKITPRKRKPQSAPLGTLKAVLSPYQYQRQINGSYLVFAHTDKTPGQQTLHLSPVNGFSHRAGLRWEEVSSGKWFRGDRGTYFEVGAQLSVLNDILAAVTLSTPGTPAKPCGTNSNLTIFNCFKQVNYPVTAATTVSAQLAALHSPGLYWDAHFQKILVSLSDKSGPGVSLLIDTKGDSFFRRGANKTLSSQTLYDVPVSIALAFPIFRNFSIGPNYQAFFYGNQVAAQHLLINSFSLTGRWYLDRDAAVRPHRQIVFKGPISTDETKTARMK